MKLKKIFASILMLVSFFGAPMNLLAASEVPTDTTSEVNVTSGENITVGNVTVEGNLYAVSVYASTTDSSVLVEGDVKLTTETEGTVLDLEANGSSVDATINGDIEGESDSVIKGVGAIGGAGDDYTATATIDGDITVTGDEKATGVSSEDASITVTGKITANGEDATGVGALSISSSSVTASDIEVNGEYVTGARLGSFTEGDDSGNTSLCVTNDIVATATSETYSSATGIDIDNRGGKITATVNGDVKVYSDNGSAYGVMATSEDMNEEIERISNVHIDGDLTSSEYGIYAGGFDSKTRFNVYVGGTINADKAAILLDGNQYTSSNTDLTVWKINRTSDDTIALKNTIVEDQKIKVRDQDFERSINYIIKTESIEGATLSLTDAQGKVINGVAKEGDIVFVKIDLEKNYNLLAVYDGVGVKTELTRDSNGNYFMIVPRGGGVYLSLAVSYTIPAVTPVPASAPAPAPVAGVRPAGGASGVLGVRTSEQSNPKSDSKIHKIDDSSIEAVDPITKATAAEEPESLWLGWLLTIFASIGGFGAYKYVANNRRKRNLNNNK